ncbi:unnamed protein product [Hapterophycus canaliculatus]
MFYSALGSAPGRSWYNGSCACSFGTSIGRGVSHQDWNKSRIKRVYLISPFRRTSSPCRSTGAVSNRVQCSWLLIRNSMDTGAFTSPLLFLMLCFLSWRWCEEIISPGKL